MSLHRPLTWHSLPCAFLTGQAWCAYWLQALLNPPRQFQLWCGPHDQTIRGKGCITQDSGNVIFPSPLDPVLNVLTRTIPFMFSPDG
jgi:hypothetical protein